MRVVFHVSLLAVACSVLRLLMHSILCSKLEPNVVISIEWPLRGTNIYPSINCLYFCNHYFPGGGMLSQWYIYSEIWINYRDSNILFGQAIGTPRWQFDMKSKLIVRQSICAIQVSHTSQENVLYKIQHLSYPCAHLVLLTGRNVTEYPSK